MRKYLLILLPFPLLLIAALLFASAEEPVLVLDAVNKEVLPRSFRTCLDALPDDAGVSREGLDTLLISGSAQFSELELGVLLKKINHKGNLIVVDLRGESHGFINGNAVSWFVPHNIINAGKTDAESKRDELQLLNSVRALKQVTITEVLSMVNYETIKDTGLLIMKVFSVMDEDEITKHAKVGYKRFFVQDHAAPTEEQVDAFLAFVIQNPAETWLHFHCKAGKGRTTTFMCLYDMLRNAKNVSFDTIMRRQQLLDGDYDVLHLGSPLAWKYPYAVARTELLKQFYQYARSNSDGFKTNWTSYIHKVKTTQGSLQHVDSH